MELILVSDVFLGISCFLNFSPTSLKFAGSGQDILYGPEFSWKADFDVEMFGVGKVGTDRDTPFPCPTFKAGRAGGSAVSTV